MTDETQRQTTEEWLLGLYKRPHLTTDQLAKVLNYTDAHSVVEAVRRGIFPVKTFRLGRKRVADVRDVAKYLDEQRDAAA